MIYWKIQQPRYSSLAKFADNFNIFYFYFHTFQFYQQHSLSVSRIVLSRLAMPTSLWETFLPIRTLSSRMCSTPAIWLATIMSCGRRPWTSQIWEVS